MAAGRIIVPNYMPALDLNGNPLAGAKLYFYENGTTTLKTTYTSAALSVAHPNPVIANAAGVFASIFADTTAEFSVAITDADGAPISGLRNRDNVQATIFYGEDVVTASAASAAAAAADAVATAADRVQTAADRVQTGLDRVQTGLDRVATAADVVSTGADAAAADAARVLAEAVAAASALGVVYTSVALGVAGTVNNQYFLVSPTTGGLYLYQRLAGVGTYVATIQTGAGYIQDGDEIGTIVAVVRQTTASGGWSAITTGGHNPHGYASIAVVSGTTLRVTSDFTGSAVGTFMVQPDESYAAWNLTLGASVGTNVTDISGYAPISGVIKASTTGIVWNTQVGNYTSQTVDTAAGTITVVHGSQSHTAAEGSAVMLSPVSVTSTAGFAITSATKTGFVLQYVDDLSCRIACTTATPGSEVFTVSETNNTGITAAWITGTNCVRVTYPAVGNNKPDANITLSRDSAARYIFTTDSQGTTTCDIFFYDLAGTLLTAASTNMIFHFSKPGKFARSIPSGSTVLGHVQRDMIPVNFDNLYAASGNIWLHGIIDR